MSPFAKPMTWPYFLTGAPSGIGWIAILCPAGMSRVVVTRSESLNNSVPALSGRLMTATSSVSRRRRANASNFSCLVVMSVNRSFEAGEGMFNQTTPTDRQSTPPGDVGHKFLLIPDEQLSRQLLDQPFHFEAEQGD